MRNSHNITLTNNDSLTEVEDTTWSLPGAVVGFLSWLCALAIPMLIYGSNTLLFLSTPAFLSGADARRCSGGDCTAFIDGRKATPVLFHLATVGIMFGALFMWLLG